MLGQCVDDLLKCSALESFLLCSSPLLRGLGTTTRGGLGQICTHMVVVAQKSALCSIHFPGLQPDPFGSISQRVNLAVESPSDTTCTVTPPPSDFINFSKGGSVHFVDLAAGLGLP